ncbi:MAG: hypothetical protein HWE13_03970 [Gammaproteobacteria bacterium]|nr:hypothetical protein [Gammaproteobacteria bacterium]
MTKTAISVLGLSLFAASTSFAFDIEEQRELTLDAKAVQRLTVTAGAGFLKVVADEQATKIEVVGALNVDEGNFTFSLEQSGDVAKLVADANTGNTSSWWGDGPKIDLTVKVPSHVFLDIEDGSGMIEIDGAGNGLKLNDGSGSISLRNIRGNVDVKDGSGSFSAENISGDLVLDDGSGSIRIEQVTGNVVVDDGSGSTLIERVSGTVMVDDGSGSLTIANIGGHVTIDDGSGGITLDQLEAGVTILNEGSGGLSMSNVKGQVEKR